MSLSFIYGTMNSSKTAMVIMKLKHLNSQGKNVTLIKPSVENRSGSNTIKSRAFPEPVIVDILIHSEMNDFSTLETDDYILVDEAQFLSKKNVNGLKNISNKVTVLCYGLLTDYKGELFEGSKRLVEVCDEMEEMKSTCSLCTRKSKVNAKYIVRDEERLFFETGTSEPDIGSDEKYQPMCWWCFKDTKKVNSSNKVTMFFDGGSRGNPGIAGCGAVIYDEMGNEIHAFNIKMKGDNNTNNEAEYTAFILGLSKLIEHGYTNVLIKGDSQLVIKQVNGEYKCKSQNLINFYDRAIFMLGQLDVYDIQHIPRDQNKRADELANIAMDGTK